MRKAIIFDGKKWHVRRIRVITHDLERDEKVYRCDKPLSSDHNNLSEVPEVQAIAQQDARGVARKITVQIMKERHAPGKGMSLPEWEKFIVRCLEQQSVTPDHQR